MEREMKGGRDCRNPAIGRQVIGYFGWPASPISLLGGQLLQSPSWGRMERKELKKVP